MNSFWFSTIHNTYGTSIREGIAWFIVDFDGNYTGYNITRSPDSDCLVADTIGWKGKLYEIGKDVYAAYNDIDLDSGFYIFNISPDGLVAHSLFLVKSGMKNISETNIFTRKNINFDVSTIKEVSKEYLCK